MIAQFKEKINPFFAFFENIFRSKKRVILRILSILVYIILVFPARKKFLRSPPLAAKEGLSQKKSYTFPRSCQFSRTDAVEQVSISPLKLRQVCA